MGGAVPAEPVSGSILYSPPTCTRKSMHATRFRSVPLQVACSVLLLLCAAASGCTKPAILPVSGAFADTLREPHVWYTAGIRDRGDTLDAVLVLTNPTAAKVEQIVAGSCTVLLVAHRTAERLGIPVWEDYERTLSDGSRVGVNFCAGADRITLPPHGRQERIAAVPKSQMLEKLAPGEYHLSIRTKVEDTTALYDSRTLLLPAGIVEVEH